MAQRFAMKFSELDFRYITLLQTKPLQMHREIKIGEHSLGNTAIYRGPIYLTKIYVTRPRLTSSHMLKIALYYNVPWVEDKCSNIHIIRQIGRINPESTRRSYFLCLQGIVKLAVNRFQIQMTQSRGMHSIVKQVHRTYVKPSEILMKRRVLKMKAVSHSTMQMWP